MYMGNIVETGTRDQLYQNPMHPYSRALLDAHPIPDPTLARRGHRELLEGTIPSMLNPPSGCKFHTRCKKCMEICKKEAPKPRETEDGHVVYCHLYDEK